MAKALEMRLQWVILLIGVLSQASCASSEHPPFPAKVEFNAPGHFVFVAKGSWEFPANTASGEKMRLSWLTDYLGQTRACQSGYKISQRVPEYLKLSPKKSVEDQRLRSITYTGECL